MSDVNPSILNLLVSGENPRVKVALRQWDNEHFEVSVWGPEDNEGKRSLVTMHTFPLNDLLVLLLDK